jgi:hypothetical protein
MLKKLILRDNGLGGVNDMKYAKYIMELKRIKRGLSPDDTSQDVEIETELSIGDKMSKSSDTEFDKDKFWGNQ